MNGNEKMFYVAVCKGCGMTVASCHDNERDKPGTAKTVNGFIRRGCSVQRVDAAYVRENFGECRCKEIEAQPRLFDDEVSA